MSDATSPIRANRREYTEIGPLLTDVYYVCPDCGALVIRCEVHDRWHSDHASVVDRVAYAIFHVGPPPLAPLMSWDQARRMAAAAVKELARDKEATHERGR